MTAGATIDRLSSRVCRAYGRMRSIVKSQRIGRTEIGEIATELEDAARVLRGLISRPAVQAKIADPDCSAALLGAA